MNRFRWSSAVDVIKYVDNELRGGVLPTGERYMTAANLLARRDVVQNQVPAVKRPNQPIRLKPKKRVTPKKRVPSKRTPQRRVKRKTYGQRQ
jgi:hypothetical protein